MQRLFIFALPLLALISVLISHHTRKKEADNNPQQTNKSTNRNTHPSSNKSIDRTQVAISEETILRFQRKFIDFVRMGYSPKQVLAEFQTMHEEDRNALIEAMVRLEGFPAEINQELLPLLGEAFVLWPKIEGVYLAFLGYPYQDTMPTKAAAWATKFLVTNERKDLVAAAAVANLGSTDERGALELISTLPKKAKIKAVGAFADHVDFSDINRLMVLAKQWDPEGKSHFTERVFHRLGFERLEEVSAWLAKNPDADPTAAAAIAVHMTTGTDKKAAIEWADSLQNEEARAAAISATYQRWSLSDFDGAVGDILSHYPEATQLVAEVFKGTTYERAGSSAHYWEKAKTLKNDSARSYAITGLIEPMLLSNGLETTKSYIQALLEGSLERQTAERTLVEVVKRPVIGQRLQELEKMAQENTKPVTSGE